MIETPLLTRPPAVQDTPAPCIIARPVPLQALSAAEWDGFAARCGASYHCALAHIRAWRLLRTVRVFELVRQDAGGEARIGQCAVALGGRRRFLDSLQLLPDHAAEWPAAMAAVLRALGPGTYRYGSTWSLQPRREALLRDLPGISIEHVQPMAVQAVDFGAYAGWDAYLRAVSTNARRNARKAAQAYPDLVVKLHEGPAMQGQVPKLTWLRNAVCRRKRLRFRLPHEWLRAAARAEIWRRYGFIASVEAGGRTLGMFSGIRFGGSTCYLEGASRADNDGASWYLMLEMLRHAYAKHPQGHFIMGIVTEDAKLTRSREQCRVADHPTSIVEFRYAGATG